MGLIQREIDQIRTALLNGAPRHDELYAAMTALEWCLEPSGIRSPLHYIMGTAAGSKDCRPAYSLASSEYTHDAQMA